MKRLCVLFLAALVLCVAAAPAQAGGCNQVFAAPAVAFTATSGVFAVASGSPTRTTVTTTEEVPATRTVRTTTTVQDAQTFFQLQPVQALTVFNPFVPVVVNQKIVVRNQRFRTPVRDAVAAFFGR